MTKFYPDYNFMVDKIQKALNKFSVKEKALVKELLKLINVGAVAGLDIKKLKGQDHIYRVRKGKIRIIYRIVADNTYLVAIERRNDNTYRDL